MLVEYSREDTLWTVGLKNYPVGGWKCETRDYGLWQRLAKCSPVPLTPPRYMGRWYFPVFPALGLFDNRMGAGVRHTVSRYVLKT